MPYTDFVTQVSKHMRLVFETRGRFVSLRSSFVISNTRPRDLRAKPLKKVIQQLQMLEVQLMCCLDSSIGVSGISSSANRLKQFPSIRVQIIQSITSSSSWIPGSEFQNHEGKATPTISFHNWNKSLPFQCIDWVIKRYICFTHGTENDVNDNDKILEEMEKKAAFYRMSMITRIDGTILHYSRYSSIKKAVSVRCLMIEAVRRFNHSLTWQARTQKMWGKK